jgi:hypothetical protein
VSGCRTENWRDSLVGQVSKRGEIVRRAAEKEIEASPAEEMRRKPERAEHLVPDHLPRVFEAI